MYILRFSCQGQKFREKESHGVRLRMRTALLELTQDSLIHRQPEEVIDQVSHVPGADAPERADPVVIEGAFASRHDTGMPRGRNSSPSRDCIPHSQDRSTPRRLGLHE